MKLNVYHTCSIVEHVTVPLGIAFSLQVFVFLSCSENSVLERTISRDGFPLLLPGKLRRQQKAIMSLPDTDHIEVKIFVTIVLF